MAKQAMFAQENAQSAPPVIKSKVDVIIPAYNCHSTIDRCLNSIAMQTISKDLKVTIVDDCSPDGDYNYLIDRYKDILDIQVLKMPENQGPGRARQYGIDHTSNPLMTFIDADDTFANAFALNTLREMLYANDYEKNIAAWATFQEETAAGKFIPHFAPPVWMFGKLYKRAFWEKYNICFHPTSRYNEDTGVNLMVQLLSNENEKIARQDINVYYWMNGEKTITRKYGDYDDYWDNNCLIGYAENATRTLSYVRELQPNNKGVRSVTLEVTMFLYLYYTRAVAHKAYKIAQCKWQCANFIQKCYNAEEARQPYTSTDKIIFFDKVVKSVGRVLPYCTFEEFIADMRSVDLSIPVEIVEDKYV